MKNISFLLAFLIKFPRPFRTEFLALSFVNLKYQCRIIFYFIYNKGTMGATNVIQSC